MAPRFTDLGDQIGEISCTSDPEQCEPCGIMPAGRSGLVRHRGEKANSGRNVHGKTAPAGRTTLEIEIVHRCVGPIAAEIVLCNLATLSRSPAQADACGNEKECALATSASALAWHMCSWAAPSLAGYSAGHWCGHHHPRMAAEQVRRALLGDIDAQGRGRGRR
ncbi:hypothetical protein [Xanthomonas translucens]|uniref:hypothetical protein n=1 Tax=Xanthomonas campestris pv. translucens TaxID=343 RepID=UPI00114CD0F0|nr:hypothetical protein [Xanthomonas translucens]MBC3971702.1 hypothetical protein [Xanthomonas translucens pv. undulosa]MCT8281975.1 hypothetical protein [Xanthomonas translucens pv. undulosa]MCT8316667.1 hypothetical protein [Xanthomonas translucens pv. undulosa]QSQ42959.1 hypothetical protein ISN33_07445 [Xanthomonas translucens pv. translucens]QSQ49191.1 hypothetical protein ISN35_00375 [Xanthomonas translucens pv. undulosa]